MIAIVQIEVCKADVPRSGRNDRYMNESDNEIDFSAWRTFEHTGWEAASIAYDETFGEVTRTAAPWLIDAANITPGDNVLDVATGPGYVAAAASGRGALVIGVDFSEKMIERAWWRFPGIQFRTADAENLPFSDDSFDAVVNNFGLLHFGQPERALAESFRVLNDGGRLAFTVWKLDDKTRGFGLIYDAIETLGTIDVGLPKVAPVARFADPLECKSALEQIGFSEIRSVHIPLSWWLNEADDLYDSLTRGAVRTAALINGQSHEVQQAIRQRFRDKLDPFRKGDGFELPMPILLTSAVKCA